MLNYQRVRFLLAHEKMKKNENVPYLPEYTSINLQMLVKRSMTKAFFEAPITMGFGKKTWVAMGRAWWWNAW